MGSRWEMVTGKETEVKAIIYAQLTWQKLFLFHTSNWLCCEPVSSSLQPGSVRKTGHTVSSCVYHSITQIYNFANLQKCGILPLSGDEEFLLV